LTVISNTQDLSQLGCADIAQASISVETRGQTTLLTLAGEVDASNADFMATVLHGFINRSRSVVVDLSGSSLFGARPVGVLWDCHRRCRRDGVPFVSVTSPAQRALMRRVDSRCKMRTASSVAVAVETTDHEISPRSGAPFPLVDPEKLRC
jgi:anti-anti-sigma regulatory factor